MVSRVACKNMIFFVISKLFRCRSHRSLPISPDEKIRFTEIKQINSLTYKEFSEEYENDPCQVVPSGKKKVIGSS